MSEVAEKQRDRKGESAETRLRQGSGGQVSRGDRCGRVLVDGRRCKQKAWRGKGVCYQHDPEAAELRAKAGRPAYAKASLGYARDKSAGRPSNSAALMTVAEVQELLAEALGDLRAGRIKPGEAYAVGYLAQLALTAIGAARKARKVDVKHFWEMVDLGAAIETAVELQKKKEAEETKEAEEAESFADAQDEEAEEKADPSTSLPSTGLGTGRMTTEEEDDSEEEGVLS